jgi:hypothetical protein
VIEPHRGVDRRVHLTAERNGVLIGDVLDNEAIADLARIGFGHIDHNVRVVPRHHVVALGELILLSASGKDLQHSIHADPPDSAAPRPPHRSGAKLVLSDTTSKHDPARIVRTLSAVRRDRQTRPRPCSSRT